MGQRLNIEIIKDGETLANAYYHWSAYTSTALNLTERIIDFINENPKESESDIAYAILVLQSTGALLTAEEVEGMSDDLKENEAIIKSSDYNRNKGLISISEKGINETRRQDEGRVEIDLDQEIVDFGVYWSYVKETYIEEYEKTEEDYNQLPLFDYELNNIPFSEFDEVKESLERYYEDEYGFLVDSVGDVISFIE